MVVSDVILGKVRSALQRQRGHTVHDAVHVHCYENPIINVFPEKQLLGLSPTFISTFMCLWAIYIFPGLVHIFSCSRIGRPNVRICIPLTDTWMWKLGLRPHNFFSGYICFEYSLLCLCSVVGSNVEQSLGYSTYIPCLSHILLLRGS